MTRYSVHICMEVLFAYTKFFFLSITAISESHTMAGSFLSKYQHKTHSNKGYGLLGRYKVNRILLLHIAMSFHLLISHTVPSE